MKHFLYLFAAATLLAGSTVRAATAKAEDGAGEPTPSAPAPTDPIAHEIKALMAVLAARHIVVDPDAAQRAVVECVARTADPQARLLGESEFAHLQEERQGSDFHPGIRLSMTNATPRIAAVDTNGPAAVAGLMADDLIMAADGRALTNVTLVEATRLLRSHGTNAMELVVQRAGAALTVQVARALAPLPAIESAEKFPQNIGYLRLNGLYRDSGREIVSTLRGWAETGRFGFVLDLRGADGDDLSSVVAVGSLFAKGGDLLFAFRDHDDQDQGVYKAVEGDPLETPVMVLADGDTAGAAEALAAVLADSVRGALLLGSPTAGDALVREAVTLPGEDLLYITTRRLVTADGATYGGDVRVLPDIAVVAGAGIADGFEPEQSGDRREKLEVELSDRALRDRVRGDAALTRAVDVLLGLKALNIRASGVSSP